MFHVKPWSTLLTGRALGTRLLRGAVFEQALLLELTASGVDVIAARIANGGLYPVLRKSLLQLLYLMYRRGLERATVDVVELNQIDVA